MVSVVVRLSLHRLIQIKSRCRRLTRRGKRRQQGTIEELQDIHNASRPFGFHGPFQHREVDCREAKRRSSREPRRAASRSRGLPLSRRRPLSRSDEDYLAVNMAHWDRHGRGLWVLRTKDGAFAGRAGMKARRKGRAQRNPSILIRSGGDGFRFRSTHRTASAPFGLRTPNGNTPAPDRGPNCRPRCRSTRRR